MVTMLILTLIVPVKMVHIVVLTDRSSAMSIDVRDLGWPRLRQSGDAALRFALQLEQSCWMPGPSGAGNAAPCWSSAITC